MPSFPSSLTSPQRATLRTSGYWSRVLACLNPNDIVWQARVNQTITNAPFTAFAWDNQTIGAYTDVWEGLVCYISSTTDLTDVKYRGRVRLAPSSNTFYISYNSTLLTDGDYITVVADADLFTRHRNDTLIDDSVVYHALPPMLTGLPSVFVLYDSDADGQVTLTPAQTGIPVDALATTVDAWSWSVWGDGASGIDDPTLEHPAFTFAAGYHYLVRVEYTDDNDESNYQISHVYAITRTFDAPVVQPIVTGTIDGEDGWTANLTAYGDVTGILDRTHCAIFHVQHFGDDSSDPIVSNVLMNGRIRSSSIQTEGSAEAGQEQQVTFAVEGITAYMRRLRFPNDIVRPVASPDEWGEITSPTPYRMAVYAMWAYSTLTNIASFGVEDGAFEDWTIGGEPRGIDGGYTTDVLDNLLSPIHAAPNYAPDGEIFLAIDVNYKQDRSGVPLVTTFTLDDMISYGVDLDSSNTVSQVIAYGGSFDSATNDFVLYSASAPTVVYLEGEGRELNREILTVDASIDDARDELKQRASDHYAFENSKPLMSLTLFDSYAGVIIPTNFQRWAAVLPASSNTLGRAWDASDYWLLQSVSLSIGTDGTIGVSGQWPAETTFDDAQSQARLLPINLEDMNPVLPVLANEPAFPTDPAENYPTDFPSVRERQPIDPFSGMMAYTPFPPDVAAAAAARQAAPGCKVMSPPVNFKVSGNVTSSFTTVLGDPYLITVSGSAQIVVGAGLQSLDMVNTYPGTWNNDPVFVGKSGTDDIWELTIVDAFGTLPPPTYNISDSLVRCFTVEGATPSGGAFTTYASQSCTGSLVTGPSYPPNIYQLNILGGYGSVAGMTAQFILRPVVPIPGEDVYADAFYTWNLDEDGNITNVQLDTTRGLRLDNSAVAVPPPFDESHRYVIPFTGTGNVLLARYQDDDYTDNQSAILYLEICPKEA